MAVEIRAKRPNVADKWADVDGTEADTGNPTGNNSKAERRRYEHFICE